MNIYIYIFCIALSYVFVPIWTWAETLKQIGTNQVIKNPEESKSFNLELELELSETSSAPASEKIQKSKLEVEIEYWISRRLALASELKAKYKSEKSGKDDFKISPLEIGMEYKLFNFYSAEFSPILMYKFGYDDVSHSYIYGSKLKTKTKLWNKKVKFSYKVEYEEPRLSFTFDHKLEKYLTLRESLVYDFTNDVSVKLGHKNKTNMKNKKGVKRPMKIASTLTSELVVEMTINL